jgi:hypothetical protein
LISKATQLFLSCAALRFQDQILTVKGFQADGHLKTNQFAHCGGKQAAVSPAERASADLNLLETGFGFTASAEGARFCSYGIGIDISDCA